MGVSVIVDKKGRIVIPKEFRELLGIRAGDELLLKIEGKRIIIEKTTDPFKVLEEILGDLTFDRRLRTMAEEEAVKSFKKRADAR